MGFSSEFRQCSNRCYFIRKMCCFFFHLAMKLEIFEIKFHQKKNKKLSLQVIEFNYHLEIIIIIDHQCVSQMKSQIDHNRIQQQNCIRCNVSDGKLKCSKYSTIISFTTQNKISNGNKIRTYELFWMWSEKKKKGIKKHKHKHTYSATRTYNRQQKIQLIRCHLTCMTVISHSTWKILYTKNKCAQHAYTPAYVGVKQIEKLESLDSHTTMIIVQCAWFHRREVRFQYKMPVFCSFFLEIFIFTIEELKVCNLTHLL